MTLSHKAKEMQMNLISKLEKCDSNDELMIVINNIALSHLLTLKKIQEMKSKK